MQSEHRTTALSRKKFLVGTVLVAGIGMNMPVLAANEAPSMSPDDALAKLKAGNTVFVKHMTTTSTQMIEKPPSLGKGYAPFSTLQSSFVAKNSTEIIINQRHGEIIP